MWNIKLMKRRTNLEAAFKLNVVHRNYIRNTLVLLAPVMIANVKVKETSI